MSALCQPLAMDLFAYSKHSGESLAALARRMHMHRGHLHKIAHGARGWTSETSAKIEMATGGLVTANDLARVRREFLTREGTRAEHEEARA